MSHKTRSLSIAGAIAAIIVAIGILAAPSSMAAGLSKSQFATHCTTVIERINPNQAASRIVSQQCSDDPNAAILKPSATDTMLVTFFRDANFQPQNQNTDTIYGTSGPCDSTGYAISDLSYSNDVVVGGISSYYYWNNCTSQIYWNGLYETGASKSNTDDCAYVGNTWNDVVYSMKLWS